MSKRVYGTAARIGLVTPQANPTAEPEMHRLLPPEISLLVARSVSQAPPLQRLRDYLEQIESAIEQFGGLALDALGFACTASSYLLEAGQAQALIAKAQRRFGFPVITAANAIESYLREHDVQRLLIASPYPAWIHEASINYWTGRGFSVVAASSAAADMTDTREIYELDTDQAAEHFHTALAGQQADTVLITGTGMPSLPVIPELRKRLAMPVVSSNVCLAWACLRAAGVPTETLRMV